jgi:hypothetical protein
MLIHSFFLHDKLLVHTSTDVKQQCYKLVRPSGKSHFTNFKKYSKICILLHPFLQKVLMHYAFKKLSELCQTLMCTCWSFSEICFKVLTVHNQSIYITNSKTYNFRRTQPTILLLNENSLADSILQPQHKNSVQSMVMSNCRSYKNFLITPSKDFNTQIKGKDI